ncbi:MAG: endonuclease domain-containing protein [Firmicutes bacterium]|nr:endonuclease domain-containing protein [Bacillota bacterium]
MKRASKEYHNLPYNAELKQRASELRKAGNLSEVLLWMRITKGQFKGLDFDRQKIIGNYIVDFYCPQKRVVIEIDGESHNEKFEYDTKRDEYLRSLGLEIIRLLDKDIKKNLENVIEYLKSHEVFADEH